MGCIYKATNKIDGKIYIGQTIRTMSERKWAHHYELHDKTRAHDMPFHRAIKKYGKDSFIWECLADDIDDIKELNRLEIHYIALYNSIVPNGYNLQHGGRNGLHSEETKKKMSISHMNRIQPEYKPRPVSIRQIILHAHMNTHYKPLSHRDRVRMVNGEGKKSMSLRKAKYGAIHADPLFKAKKHEHYSKAQKDKLNNPAYLRKLKDNGQGNEVVCVETNNSYSSIREAARILGMDRRDMRRIIGFSNRTYKGLHYIYIAPSPNI